MKLSNDKYVLEVVNEGGEIQSFYSKERNIEYMWQGSEDSWTGKNPSLFPLCCGLFKKSYELDGKVYPMENHGFIRVSTLDTLVDDGKEVTMGLKPNDYTKERYPFDFDYKINYKLNNNKINIKYTITNEDEKDMPFTFGLHPGFNAPILDGEKFSDYKVVFEIEEDVDRMFIDKTKTRYPDIKRYNISELQLNAEDYMNNNTIIFRDLKSKYVDLVGPKESIRISIEGFKYLAIWCVPNAGFICIEPWHACGDFYDIKEDIYNRKDTIVLKPGEVWNTEYSIEILED